MASGSGAKAWEGWYCISVVMLMFVCLLRNVAGPDVLMLGALALELAAGIVSIEDGLKGFSNKGLLTVACLFVVAAGISNTGALDYYMGKLLGNPRSVADAQLRLMVPIATVSAFLNNTPVVAIMIPIVQNKSVKQIDKAWSELSTKTSKPNPRINKETILLKAVRND